MNKGHRRFVLLDAACVDEAKKQLQTNDVSGDFVCIDMTQDFNQNKWLGQELGDALIFFSDKTRLNGLLAVLGCVKAPCRVVLACDFFKLTGYFKQQVFIPALQAISLSLNDMRSAFPPNDVLIAGDETKKALIELQSQTGISHLIGERGSGKSTLLGTYLSQCVKNGDSVVLSAPIAAAAKNAFIGFEKNSDVSRETPKFFEPKQLKTNMANADVIAIDEAATYPGQILQQLICYADKHNKRLVLSTTIEGYEGTGQSYRLNYLDNIDEVHCVYLKTPKRFLSSDSLYQLCRSLWRPSAQYLSVDDGIYVLNHIELRNKGWTKTCFALLREAHYKTTPNDLENFYNQTACFVVMIKQAKMIAAIYALPEKLPGDVNCNDIFNGKRRIKNALTHQALISAYGVQAISAETREAFLGAKVLRISRIAVVKSKRRQGVATRLIQHLSDKARQGDYAFISTSFSASKNNVAFWLSQSFVPARIGLYVNKSNNEYAVLMLKSLSKAGDKIQQRCLSLITRHLHYFANSYPKHCLALAKSDDNSMIISREQLLAEMDSVLLFYRDINWLLPVVNRFLSHNQEIMRDFSLCDGKMRHKQTYQQDCQQLLKLADFLKAK